jgi:hypothetical protein
LINLFSFAGGTVLDPFVGSGTINLAAIATDLVAFVGISSRGRGGLIWCPTSFSTASMRQCAGS